jgi:GNAT superfamily N-acetyltransferase
VWHARPLLDDDIPEVVAMVNACETADSGEAMLDADDVSAGLAHIDRERDACVVVREGRIVGWSLLWDLRRRWADVHPDARGGGIGTWLERWSVWRSRQRGAPRLGQTIDDRREDVVQWFAGLGYTSRYTSWVLTIPAARGEFRAVPAEPGEVDAALEVFERGFSEFQDRTPLTREQWRAQTVQRSDFRPENLLVVRDAGRPVAAAFLVDSGEIWVDKLAVDPAFRGQGLARDLVAAARDRAARQGHPGVRLSTDSNAGALEVYLRLGMSRQRSYTHWALDLPSHDVPGRQILDLAGTKRSSGSEQP